MKIGILAINHNLYSHKRLYEAGINRGHEMIFINTLQCYIELSSNGPVVHHKDNKRIDNIDAIIPRIGSSITFYGTAVVRQFEMMNIYTVNSSTAISRSRDKLRSLQLLARRGINMPISGFTHTKSNPSSVIDLVGGAPLIIKLLQGTQGKGVVIAETNQAAESVISAFQGLNADILVQEFIKEANGRDIRCFVVGVGFTT
ncbi:MAG: RimK family alpha-L-glutamate ligase [Flavobacterium sp.]|nr:MAG: RimK family alpha-L-glutamate ligase [Flavobacterium sp.]